MLKRLAARVAVCLMLAVASAAVVDTGLALAQAVQTSTVSGSTLDLSGLFSQGLQAVMLAILTVASWFLNRHVKNADARAVMLNVLDKGLSYGMNKVKGAVPGSVLTVDVGSAVVANALAFAIDRGPDAAKTIGLDRLAIAKMLWARLPAVDGEVSEDTFKTIVAMAENGGNAPAPTMSDLSKAMIPALEVALTEFLAKYRAGQTAAP